MADKKELDMIDAAMVADDTDYGDGDTTTNENNSSESTTGDAGGDGNQSDHPQDTRPENIERNQQQPQQQNRESRTQQQDQVPQGLKRVGREFADSKGNIVDKTGKIIAGAGESARHWQAASRATARVGQLERQLQATSQMKEADQRLLAQAREIAEMPTKLGVSREDFNEGITLIKQFGENPVNVAREIVARTLALGYNVTDILGAKAGDALEMKAVTRLVNDATAPIREQRDREARLQENNTRAEGEYNKFVARYPDAETHGNEIAHLMKSRNLNAVEAYHEVKLFAAENRLDFNEPLGPQIQALQSGRGQSQQPGARRHDAPMPNGHRGNDRNTMTTEPEMANGDDDWASIIKSSMRN